MDLFKFDESFIAYPECCDTGAACDAKQCPPGTYVYEDLQKYRRGRGLPVQSDNGKQKSYGNCGYRR